MGCAPMAHVLWSKIMSYNPANPKWVSDDDALCSAPAFRNCGRRDALPAGVRSPGWAGEPRLPPGTVPRLTCPAPGDNTVLGGLAAPGR